MKVFISYRRDDSAGHAGRLHDRLQREFGRDLLFMDVDNIPLAANFAKVLADALGECDVLLAIIGPGWLDARNETGQRRLDNPNDFVRMEIATALKRDIPIVPIFLEGARAPDREKLPKEIEGLALRQGHDVRHASFHGDMDTLIKRLRASVASAVKIIEPGRGIGPVRLEMNEGKVVALLGEPDYSSATDFTKFLSYKNLGMMVGLQNGVTASIFAFNGRGDEKGWTAFSGTIEGRLSLSAHTEDVISIYGKPTHYFDEGRRLDYHHLGIGFQFTDAKKIAYVCVNAVKPGFAQKQ